MAGAEGLTFDEFAMGFQATLDATAPVPTYGPEDAPWTYRDGVVTLRRMSDQHPDFHSALTGVDPLSEEKRYVDVAVRVALAGIGIRLPEGPAPAEFKDLLAQRQALESTEEQ